MMNHLFDALTAFIPDRSQGLLETLDGGKITYADMFARSAQYAGALQNWVSKRETGLLSRWKRRPIP